MTWTKVSKPSESSVATSTVGGSVLLGEPIGILVAITSVTTSSVTSTSITGASVTTGWTDVAKATSSTWTVVAKPTS